MLSMIISIKMKADKWISHSSLLEQESDWFVRWRRGKEEEEWEKMNNNNKQGRIQLPRKQNIVVVVVLEVQILWAYEDV